MTRQTRLQTRPQTLAQWLRELRRRGMRCRLTNGRVRYTGLRTLTAAERRALFASSEQVQQLQEQRAERRRPKQEKQLMVTTQPQQTRRVIGQVVRPGLPLRLLFEDECKPIAPSPRARQLVGLPYGWSK